jgi:hypothetical protein
MNSCVGFSGLPRNIGAITPVANVGWSETGTLYRVVVFIPSLIGISSLGNALAFLNSKSTWG